MEVKLLYSAMFFVGSFFEKNQKKKKKVSLRGITEVSLHASFVFAFQCFKNEKNLINAPYLSCCFLLAFIIKKKKKKKLI